MKVLVQYLLALLLSTVLGIVNAADTAAAPIRLGWQIPWATQGQVVQSLKHTNALELSGLAVTFIGFAYGAPLNAAALAGQVDVLFTADQPALVLLSRDPAYRIVARLMYNRSCLYVSPASTLQSLRDLSGGAVMGPTGAAAERVALSAIARSGVDISKLRLGQLDMAQQAALLQKSGKTGLWTGIDALYGFDPFPAAFEEAGIARMLDCGRIVSVVVASGDMVSKRSAELRKFLSAFALGWLHYASQPAQASNWFIREARLDVSAAVLDKAASVEPNMTARKLSDLRLDFDAQDLANLQETAKFLRARGLHQQEIDPASFIDTRLVRSIVVDPALAEQARQLVVKP